MKVLSIFVLEQSSSKIGSRKKPLIYWSKSRLVFSHNLNHDQFCNTLDIQVIVSGHVETVVLMTRTGTENG